MTQGTGGWGGGGLGDSTEPEIAVSRKEVDHLLLRLGPAPLRSWGRAASDPFAIAHLDLNGSSLFFAWLLAFVC